MAPGAMLERGQAVLACVDLQERLLPAIHDGEAVVRRAVFMIRAARLLGVPIVWTEQYRKGLGATDPRVAEAIGDAARPIEKLAFGCFGDAGFTAALESAGRGQLIVVGVEAHVCVMQTVLRARAQGWAVFVAEDAVGSRRPHDRDVGLARMGQAGAVPATTEMLAMELLGKAGSEEFKRLLPLLREM